MDSPYQKSTQKSRWIDSKVLRIHRLCLSGLDRSQGHNGTQRGISVSSSETKKKGSETFQNVPKPCSDVEVSLNCNIVDSNIEWHWIIVDSVDSNIDDHVLQDILYIKRNRSPLGFPRPWWRIRSGPRAAALPPRGPCRPWHPPSAPQTELELLRYTVHTCTHSILVDSEININKLSMYSEINIIKPQ